MAAGLTLVEWSYVAQLVIAAAAVLALFGAAAQVVVSRTNARRVRVYEYSDRFNQDEWTRRQSRYRSYWEEHDYEDFKRLPRAEKNELLLLPNVIEEIAALYHRKLLDREIVAESLGLYIEALWTISLPFVTAMRTEYGQDLFCDWEAMQEDTPARKLRASTKMARRRAWRKRLRR